jgi:Ser-Thr-rich glycosyl-phosphatidyl-inositol-anchored membrane family/Yeast cell wall synthesis protein KRE9/KNH1
MILRCIWVLAALLSFVVADVKFTSPAAGSSKAGLEITLEWKDSGNDPPISDLVTYQMFLCAGGNTDTSYIQLATLVQQGDFTTGNSVTATITPGLGADVENAYFIKVISAATGGTIINFSDRFSLTSMTGVFPATVQAGLKTVSGTKGPETVNQISSPQNAAPGAGSVAAGGAEFNTPYTLQSGSIRYAPMPPMAQTKISAKNASPRWPTSAYTVYQTNAGSPNAITTNTAPLTFSAVSHEATVSPTQSKEDTSH